MTARIEQVGKLITYLISSLNLEKKSDRWTALLSNADSALPDNTKARRIIYQSDVGALFRWPSMRHHNIDIGCFHEGLWFPKLSETFQNFRTVSAIDRSII